MTTGALNGTSRPITSAAARRPEPLVKTWEYEGACFNRPESWWDGEDRAASERARAECLSCPVLAQCLGSRMRDEGMNTWSRWGIHGGLRGPERTQLFLDERKHGPYDAEEARLLALEALAEGRAVADVAAADVGVTTRRLAARLAGERVEPRVPPSAAELRGGSVLERAFARSEEILQLRAAGLGVKQIAAELKLGRKPVSKVLHAHLDMLAAAVAGPEVAA